MHLLPLPHSRGGGDSTTLCKVALAGEFLCGFPASKLAIVGKTQGWTTGDRESLLSFPHYCSSVFFVLVTPAVAFCPRSLSLLRARTFQESFLCVCKTVCKEQLFNLLIFSSGKENLLSTDLISI